MHGLTDIQLTKRFKAMGASVNVILKQLERDARERSANADAAYILDQALALRLRELRADLVKLETDREEHGYTDDAEIAAIKEQTVALEAERRELNEKRSKQKCWPEIEDVREYIARLPATAKFRHCIVEIKIPKGSTVVDELARIRAEVDAIRASIRGAEIAWLPEEDAFKKAVETIDKTAITGAPDFRGLFRLSKPNPAVRRAQQGAIEWPKEVIGGDFYNAGFAFTVWLHRDALVERARTEIAALARPNSLSISEREEKIASLKVKLLAAERREEAAYLIAVKSDPSTQRRPVDMRAFLQIEEAPAAPVEQKPKTEAEFG